MYDTIQFLPYSLDASRLRNCPVRPSLESSSPMWPYRDQSEEEELESQLEDRLGRKLTPREKFYIALSQACLTRHDSSVTNADESLDDDLKAA